MHFGIPDSFKQILPTITDYNRKKLHQFKRIPIFVKINTMNTPRSCLHCGATLLGRPDKKFCDDYCRSSFNNKHYSTILQSVRSINHILLKNRKILSKSLCGLPTIRIPKDRLLEQGFNFNYFTQIKKFRNQQSYMVCYDHAYFCNQRNTVFIRWLHP